MNRTKILEQAKARLVKVNQMILDINVQRLDPLRVEANELEGLIAVLEPRAGRLVTPVTTSAIPDYEACYKKLPKVFTVDDLAAITGEKPKAYQHIGTYKRKQWITTITAGKYEKVNE